MHSPYPWQAHPGLADPLIEEAFRLREVGGRQGGLPRLQLGEQHRGRPRVVGGIHDWRGRCLAHSLQASAVRPPALLSCIHSFCHGLQALCRFGAVGQARRPA